MHWDQSTGRDPEMSDVLKRSDKLLSKLLTDITEEDEDEKTKNETIADLKTQLQQAKDQINDQQHKIQQLHVSQGEEETHEVKDLHNQVKNLKDEVDQVHRAKFGMQIDLDSRDTTQKALIKEQNDLNNELQAVKAELEAMTGQKEIAEKAAKDNKLKILFNTEIADLKTKLVDAQKAYDLLADGATQTRIDELLVTLEKVRDTNKKLNTDLEKLEKTKQMLLESNNSAQEHEAFRKAALLQFHEQELYEKTQQWEQDMSALQERLKKAEAAPKVMGLGISDADKFRKLIEKVKDVLGKFVDEDDDERVAGGPLTEYINIEESTYDFTVLTNGIKLLTDWLNRPDQPSLAHGGKRLGDSSLISETPDEVIMAREELKTARDNLQTCESQMINCEAEKRQLQSSITQKNEELMKVHVQTGAAAYICHIPRCQLKQQDGNAEFVNALQAKTQQMSSENIECLKRIGEQQIAINNQQEAITEKEQEIADLHYEIVRLREQISNMQTEIEELKKMPKHKKEKVKAKDDEAEKIHRQITDAEQETGAPSEKKQVNEDIPATNWKT